MFVQGVKIYVDASYWKKYVMKYITEYLRGRTGLKLYSKILFSFVK